MASCNSQLQQPLRLTDTQNVPWAKISWAKIAVSTDADADDPADKDADDIASG